MAEENKIDAQIKRVGALTREVQNLTAQLEKLREAENANVEEISKLEKELASTTEQLVEAKERSNDFQDAFRLQQGSPLEKFRNSLGLIQEAIVNLDPGKLKTGIQGGIS